MLRFPNAFLAFFFVLLLIGVAVIAWRNPENKWLFGGYPYQAYVVLGFVVVMYCNARTPDLSGQDMKGCNRSAEDFYMPGDRT